MEASINGVKMKALFVILAMFAVTKAMAVCTSPISRTNFTTGQVLASSSLNTQLNTVYTQVNELPGDCITDETITSAKIDDGTIVNADISTSAAISSSKLAVSNHGISSSSTGSFSTNSTSYVDVTNASVTIVTNGKPVEAFLVPDGSAVGSVSISSATLALGQGYFKLVRYALSDTNAGETTLVFSGTDTNFISRNPPGSIHFYDAPAAGTYSYRLQAKVDASGYALSATNVKLVVREL